jgi:hypothetical protein
VRLFFILALIVASSISLTAQHSFPPPLHPHFLSLTLSLARAFSPVLEGMIEVKANEKVGIAALVGTGRVDSMPFYDFGGAVLWHVWGTFDRSFHLSLQSVYEHRNLDSGFARHVEGKGVSLGVAGGYKMIWDFGATVMVQIGADYIFDHDETTDSTGTRLPDIDRSRLRPVLNVNLGFSF